MSERTINEAMSEVAKLAARAGVGDGTGLPGCWEYQIDDQWWIAVNCHSEQKTTSHGQTVPPIHCVIEYNGWPAGLINPYEGIIAAGSGANEDSFIAALKAALALPSAPPDRE
ncbi:MAG: hypothetical protein L0219_22705 [Phycisphaerales bacterium]|nr:hypothetical protein [Phycisphaerales bacterium]